MLSKLEKQTRVSFKPNIFCYYGFGIAKNYTIFTWTLLLAHKDETFKAFLDSPSFSKTN